ncbi:MAG: hypothetical protein KJO06_12465, partial [Gemmatimonadetes bacterium]|nr:hypothetical protein [Gemmatimonadota bacterium]
GLSRHRLVEEDDARGVVTIGCPNDDRHPKFSRSNVETHTRPARPDRQTGVVGPDGGAGNG